jgi:antitoxin MazE
MQISKWGNSLAVRLPKALIERLGLKEGDDVEIRGTADGALEVVTGDVTLGDRTRSAEQWLDDLIALGPLLPADYKFDREALYPKRRGGTGPDD